MFFLSSIKLELIAFIGGAVVMILELVGSRILAPQLGTSIFVWTSLIGIVLGALSLGYWWGGKLADKKPSYQILSLILLFAGIYIGFISLASEPILALSIKLGIQTGSVLAAIALFAFPSILLGMVSPYVVRLKIQAIKTSGHTVGNLYAISTGGSIAGTFAAGFLLIPNIGSINILYSLSFILIITAFFAYQSSVKLVMIGAILTFSFFAVGKNFENKGYLVNKDTPYSHIKIFDYEDEAGRKVRAMFLDAGFNSAMYLENDDLVFDYTKFYRLDNFFKTEIKNALLIGGGGYSTARDFLRRNPTGQIDVVEIDPEVTKFAYQYFNLKDDPRLEIYHEDGRTFLNKLDKKYDVIYLDALRSIHSVPVQLTTQETIQKVYDSLSPDGLVMSNVISSVAGKGSEFLRAEYKTFRQVFPNVYVFLAQDFMEPESTQNIIIVGSKNKIRILENNIALDTNSPFSQFLKNYWRQEIKTDDVSILTDDYAPVEYYLSKIL